MEVAASVAGLVSLADTVFKYALRYYKSVKGAPAEVKDLLNEIKDLTLLLHNLSLAVYGFELQTQPGSQNSATAPRPYHLHECHQLLRRLRDGLPDLESQSGLNKLQTRLKWPFTASDTKEMLQAVSRHKQTINIAIAANSFAELQQCLSKLDETQEGIQQLKAEVRKVLNIETKISLNKKREQVLSTFTMVNPRVDFETNRDLRHPMTALWLTQGHDFAEWISNDKARIWCSGIPGAGKSVIAAAIIDECLQRLPVSPRAAVCYFFCTYKNPETAIPCNIMSTLCSQLALQHESAYRILESYHEELHPPGQLPGQMKPLRLIEVLHAMCSIFDRVYLIVDGLDECGDHTAETVNCLSKLSLAGANKNMNTALLSRDELLIREKIEKDFHWIDIEAHTEDIELYVASEMETLINERKLRLGNVSLKGEIMMKLVKGAQGMFRWVTCQLDHLCKLPTDRERRKALNHLPPDLPATYERSLKCINTQSKRLVKDTLLLMMIKDEDFDSLAMCEAISIQMDSEELDEDEMINEQEVLRHCGCLVRLLPDSQSRRKQFQFAHFTVQEFLQGDCSEYPILETYGVSYQRAKNHLMRLSLIFLTLKNFGQTLQADGESMVHMCQMRKTRPFYKIASFCWWDYDPEENDTTVRDHLRTLFRKTPNFHRWAVEVVSEISSHSRSDMSGNKPRAACVLDAISNTIGPDFTPLHMASFIGCKDICRKLLDGGAKMNLMSRYGTPLHYAVGGCAVFAPQEDFDWHPVIKKLQPPPLKRRGTVNMLLTEGVKKNLRLDKPLQQTSLLSLAVRAIPNVHNLGIVADLIRHGVSVAREDPQVFSGTYLDTWDFNPDTIKELYSNGAPILNLLDALVSIQPRSPQHVSAQMKRPEVVLYDWTFEFARSMKLDVKASLTNSTMSGDIGSRSILELVYSALKHDDTDLLETIYLCNKLRQAALFDQQSPQFSILHAAVEHKSLGCLKLLLEWGIDPNARNQKGIAPMHMCFTDDYDDDDDEMLQLLLNNGSNSLALDDEGRTIWHISASRSNDRLLEILMQQKERDAALRIVSRRGDTPIGSALIDGRRSTVELLLEFCDKKEHWKCSEPIYRAAARIGSAAVLQKLLKIGLEYDQDDGFQGNPLHWISPRSDIQCVEILKSLFSLSQRRKLDSATPFESLFSRIPAMGPFQHHEVGVLMALLSGNPVTDSIHLGTAWSILCAKVVPKTVSFQLPSRWLNIPFAKLLEKGAASAYEEHFGKSSLEPFALSVCRNTVPRLRHLIIKESTRHPLIALPDWNWISQNFRSIAEDAKLTEQMAKKPIMAQLLCEAIIHEDQHLVKLLLKLGADCHTQVYMITPFELACLPEPSANEQILGYLLDHTTPELLVREGSIKGLGPLHLTAGLSACKKGEYISTNKLQCLLDAGADPNLPCSGISPMTYHISYSAIQTAEALLDAGAVPWLCSPESFDSVLMAVYSRNWMFLTKVFNHHTSNEHLPQWDRLLSVRHERHQFRKSNALHLAALVGEINAIEFYLDNDLLTDLNAEDEDGQTPMHYAAWAGLASVVPFLVKRGGNVNAQSKSGDTPLNLAVRKQHIQCVQALLANGAGQQRDGYSPFVDAYYFGNTILINLLKTHLGDLGAESSIMNSKDEQKMAMSLTLAMDNGDIEACQRLFDLGYHVDTEILPGATPLMCAIMKPTNIDVLKWLIDSNATVSVGIFNRLKGCFYTIFHLALKNPAYNPLIARLLARYLKENGGFLTTHGNPLCLTLASGNPQGLMMLVDEISTNHREIDLNPILNPNSAGIHKQSPLHMAAKLDNLVAFRTLVDAGADIEQHGCHSPSPLHTAAINNASSVAEFLIYSGARLNRRSLNGQTPILMACLNDSSQVIQLLLEGGAKHDVVDDYGDNCLTLLTKSMSVRRSTPSLREFRALIDAGIDPFAENKIGLNAARSILISDTPAYLYYILSLFPRFYNNRLLSWATVQPRKEITMQTWNCLFLSKHLRLIRPFLTREEFLDLANLSATREHTFFCSSVITGCVEATRNFLKYGANIEHVCPDHGTPLIAALTYYQLEIVKILVRNGAMVFGHGSLAVGLPFTEYDEKSKRWLLVERHIEQPKLEERGSSADFVSTRRAGVVAAEVKMEWHWNKRRNESILEYAGRRQKIVRELRGTRVKVLRIV